MAKVIQILKNPFAVVGDRRLLFYGVVSSLAGILLAYYFQVQLQILRINPLVELTLSATILGHTIIIAALVAANYALGKVINPKTRFIDIFNVVLIALVPVYVLFFQNINNFLFDETDRIIKGMEHNDPMPQPSPLLVVSSILSLLIIIYFIYLLFVGFRTATNAKKAWHYVAFFILLLGVDTACSFLINTIQ